MVVDRVAVDVGGLVAEGGRVAVAGALVVGGRVVVAGRFVVVAGARAVVGGTVVRGGAAVVPVAARWVVTVLCVVRVVPVVGSVVHSGGSVVLSSSDDDTSHAVLSAVMVVVSVSAGYSGDGERKRLVKINVSRIAARNRPMKIAVRLSFLFFRRLSPLSQYTTQRIHNPAKPKIYKGYVVLKTSISTICAMRFHTQPDIPASHSSWARTICRPMAATTLIVTPFPASL